VAVATTSAKRRSRADGQGAGGEKVRVVLPRNKLAASWLADRQRRAEVAAAPGWGVRQALFGVFILLFVFALTVWLGGFTDRGAGVVERAMRSVLADAGFKVEHVEVRGTRRAQADEVAAQLEIEPSELIFDFNPAAAKARVESLPWVSNAAVLRLLPNRVVVVIDEREPLALWDSSSSGVTVLDATGAGIEGADPTGYSELPRLEGAKAPEAAGDLLQALARHPALARRATGFERVGGRRWDMRLAGGALVRLPEEGLEDALGELDRLQAREGLLDLPLETIDLRGDDLVLHPRALPAPGFERGA